VDVEIGLFVHSWSGGVRGGSRLPSLAVDHHLLVSRNQNIPSMGRRHFVSQKPCSSPRRVSDANYDSINAIANLDYYSAFAERGLLDTLQTMHPFRQPLYKTKHERPFPCPAMIKRNAML
jgi:hypothetical protein